MRQPDRDGSTLVFSTDPAPRRATPPRRPAPGAPPASVRIWLERKGRNGGPVSIVRGLAWPPSALAAFAGELKRACATGGSTKDGEIVLQGDHRARIAAALAERGIRAKLAGG